MLISVHVEKTAGSSFRKILEQIHTGNELVRDYTWSKEPPAELCTGPIQYNHAGEITNISPTVKTIHGHFAPIKYLGKVPNAKYVTWLRSPERRLISHYFFYKAFKADKNHNDPLVKMVQDGMGFEDFIELRQNHNRMSIFLRGLEIEQYWFVGLTEKFAEDLAYLTGMMGWPADKAQPRRENQTQLPGYKEQSTALMANEAIQARIRELNKQDFDAYNRAVALREARLREAAAA